MTQTTEHLSQNSLIDVNERWAKRSKILLLLILQLVSLGTTIKGASLLFGIEPVILGVTIPFGVILGLGTQLVLVWLFIFGEKAIKSRSKFYVMLLIYTSISIYSSFFSFYQEFSGQPINPRPQVVGSVQELIGAIEGSKSYKGADGTLSVSEEAIRNKRAERDRWESLGEYEKSDIASQELNDLEKARNSADIIFSQTNSSLEALRNLEEDIVEGKELKDHRTVIAEREEAFQALPEEVKIQIPSEVKEGEDQSQEAGRSDFLIPLMSVWNLDLNGIIPLLLASIVDITSFMLGTSDSDRNSSKNTILAIKNFIVTSTVNIRNFIPSFIEGVGFFIFVIVRSLGDIVNGIFSGVISARKRSFQAFIYTPNKISLGRDADRKRFFLHIRAALKHKYLEDSENSVIYLDFSQLISDCTNYPVLIDACHKMIASMIDMKWVQRISADTTDENATASSYEITYRLVGGLDSLVMDWLNMEERSLCQQRDLETASGEYINLVNLPSHYGSRNASKARHIRRRFGWISDKLFY